MQYLIPIILSFFFSIVIFSFFNIKVSVALYVSYLILVPFLNYTFLGISLSYNFVNLLIFISFLNFKYINFNRINFVVFFPFLFLFSLLFLEIFFTLETPFETQFADLRVSFLKTCVLSFIIWNISLRDAKVLKYIEITLIVSVFISGIYGILLMNFGGANPYTSFLSNYFNSDFDAASIYSEMSTRLSFSSASRIQSTMVHPMTWGINLCFLLVVFVTIGLKERKKLYLVLVTLIGFNVLISGVRTGVFTLIFISGYYLFRKRSFKMLIYSFLALTCGYVILTVSKDIYSLFTSIIFDSSANEMEGSSISLRLQQFAGVLDEIKQNLVFGKGYGWTNLYQVTKGDHPVILAFESLLFIVLCNSGFFGLAVWVIFFFLLFKLNRVVINSRNDVLKLDSLVLVYLVYSLGTGEYGYLSIFSIYYSFLISYLFYLQKRNKLKELSI